MSIGKDEVRAIARLARIDVPAQAEADLAGALSKIIDFVSELNAAQTDGVEPLAQPVELTAHLRADAVTESDRREAYQAIAPQVADGLYLVPKVLE